MCNFSLTARMGEWVALEPERWWLPEPHVLLRLGLSVRRWKRPLSFLEAPLSMLVLLSAGERGESRERSPLGRWAKIPEPLVLGDLMPPLSSSEAGWLEEPVLSFPKTFLRDMADEVARTGGSCLDCETAQRVRGCIKTDDGCRGGALEGL